ncbi:MAG: ClpXP protease specificity-enhancing factor SspB [Myxococcaceae bacterium]
MDKKADEKKDRIVAALDKGMVMIHLDARRPGVIVPQNLRGEAHLRLNLSYKFDPPDLSIGEWGLRSTLSFSGSRFTVAVPWSALFAITSYVTREFWIYPDDMPKELIEASMVPTRIESADIPEGSEQQAPKPGRPQLREVTGERNDEPPESPEGPKDDPPRPAQRGHLRIVK